MAYAEIIEEIEGNVSEEVITDRHDTPQMSANHDRADKNDEEDDALIL